MCMNRTLARVVTGALLGGLAPIALATNGDQMIGVTATQHGMAGAFIVAPQDAAIVLFNPAGLTELGINEFRSDLGFGIMNPERHVNGYESDSKYYLMPGGALAYKLSDRSYFGMGMGGLSGMGVDFLDVAAAPGNQTIVTTKQFYKISPSFAHRVDDKLSLGASLNINYQSLAMANSQANLNLPQEQVYGFGFALGMIYRASDSIQFGASYISKAAMDEFVWNTSNGQYRMTMDGPPQLTLGVAFRPANGVLIEADVKRIWFSKVLNEVPFETPAGPSTMNFGWDDQTVFALGIQKELSADTTIRAGYNYGKSPIGPEDVIANRGSLAVVEHHLSFGATKKLSNRLAGSLSYMKAFHNDVTSSDGTTKIELEQNIINLQLSYSN